MLEAIVQSHEELSNFLSAFRGAFRNKPQFRHFQAYIVGLLIYLGSRNLAGLSRAIAGSKDASSVFRFIARMDWDVEEVENIRWEMLNRRTRRALQAAGRKDKVIPVFLAVDDTLVEKTGKKMEGVDYHRDHSTNRSVLGHVWVTAHLVVMGQSYPVSWKLYRRQVTCEALDIPFFSKPELAEMILRTFEPLPGTQTYVLTDSWYPSQKLLDVCEERGFYLISAVKSDRKFKHAGRDMQVQQWAKSLPKRAFDFVMVNTSYYKFWSVTGTLSSGHTVKLVINRIVGNKRRRYLFSTDLSLTPPTIIGYYLVRWEVENFYRTAKQSLGWGDYQMRDLFAIERHVQLMMVAHAYLELQRQDWMATADAEEHVTFGDIQREHQALSRRVEIAHVYDLAQRGFTLDSVYQQLAA
jgi:SRSO17 transposase